MVIVVILTGAFIATTQLLAAGYLFRRYKREKEALLRNIKLYFTAPDANTPSEFFKLVAASGDIVAQSLFLRLKGQEGQAKGVNNRRERMVNEAVVKDMAGQASPILALLLEQFPELSKVAGRNPAVAANLMEGIAGFLSKKKETGPVVDAGGNGDYSREMSKY